MQKSDFFHGSNDAVDGSFILMEQTTGNLQALIAGRDFQLNDINHVITKKQPGSVIKPLAVYGPAMQLGNYLPYDLIPDQDINYDGYRVGNADDNYEEEVTLYQAVVESKNAPAVWILDQIGIEYSKSILEKMKINISDSGLAMALGGLETGLDPIQITEGYRTFIHHGEWIEARSIDAILDRDQEKVQPKERETKSVFNSQTSWNMLRMLEAVVEEGTGEAGDYEKALAGKTGSTQHPRVEDGVKDAWFAGVTPEYVVTAWIGYDIATAENYLTTGSEASTRLTKSILTEINKRQSLTEIFTIPDDVEDLPQPIELPTITDITASIQFGGFSILRGELNWTPAEDSRIIYRIFEQAEEGDRLVGGEVEGQGSYTISQINVFQTGEYYVVPYNPLTKQTGEPSNVASLKFDF